MKIFKNILKFRNEQASQSGRSMVEMLGVLAIIGILTIGGVYGYLYGMDRYRTNEILDGGTKRAYTVATQLSMGLQPDLSEFDDYNAVAGGTFGGTDGIQLWDGEFGLSITGVKKAVCENLIRMIGDNTPLRAITKPDETELVGGDCANENNALFLVYNIGDAGDSEESSRVCEGNGDCAAGLVCRGGKCVCEDPCDSSCSKYSQCECDREMSGMPNVCLSSCPGYNDCECEKTMGAPGVCVASCPEHNECACRAEVGDDSVICDDSCPQYYDYCGCYSWSGAPMVCIEE